MAEEARQQAAGTDSKLQGWFAGRLPDGWFVGVPDVTYDRDEILVWGTLAEPDAAKDADDDDQGGGPARADPGFP